MTKPIPSSGRAQQEAVPRPEKVPPLTPAAVGRAAFYRAGYRRILKIAVSEAIVILILVAVFFFIIDVHRPEDRYFAATEDGTLIEMQSLYYPNLSTKAITSWSAQAATEVMTFGFHDYQRRFQESSRNFTETGWKSFIKSLTSSRLMSPVISNQQLVLAAPAGAPVLIEEGIVKGVYQWKVQVPLVITYQAQSKVSSSELWVTLTLVPVEDVGASSGVGIEQWYAQ
ncbi:MAG: DotI/IcmL/TraM family protein [Alphaproteobacteria bacterium]|nr:DotI/IcmL/TraM family protein [Alphaproteobacteria bacterium]